MYDSDYTQYLKGLRVEAEEAGFVVRDSGSKAQYEDGMQRDDPKGKPKFSLMWPKGVPYEEQLLYRVAMHYMHGGEKYGDRNWEKSCTEESLAAHEEALWRHFSKFYAGVEDGEDHAAAVVWNINAVLLTRRNIGLKKVKEIIVEAANEVFEEQLVVKAANEVAEEQDAEFSMDDTQPEWARHTAQCCSAPAYSSLPFILEDGCGKGDVPSMPLDDPFKSYTFPYIDKNIAFTGNYCAKEIRAGSYSEAKGIFDNWLSGQPFYNGIPETPPLPPEETGADLEWSDGDVLEEVRMPLAGRPYYCWAYRACSDTWLYQARAGDLPEESARSSRKLFAEFGPLKCTKGNHAGKVVDGA